MASKEEVTISLEEVQNETPLEHQLVDEGKLTAWLEDNMVGEDMVGEEGATFDNFMKRLEKERFMERALNYAVENDNLDAARILIEHGTSITIECLKTAIQQCNRPMVTMLLGLSQRGKEGMLKHVELLKYWNAETDRMVFSDLITNIPEVAEKVLDRCISESGATNHKDYKILFDCSLFEDTATNKCYQNLPCSCVWKYLSSWLSCNFKISEAACYGDDDDSGREYEKRAHPLYAVMKSDNLKLLKHPVVQELLDYKLCRFGWWLYYFNLLLYLLLVCILISFILLLPNPQDAACFSLLNNASLVGNASDNLSAGFNCSNLDSSSRLTALKTVGLILAFFRLIMELVQLYNRKFVGYLNDPVNWFELGCYISIIIFLVSVDRSTCYCPQTWKWEVGVVALVLAWVVLILWLQTMHVIGLYVTTLIRIIVLFIPVAVFGVLLVVGFGLSFFVLFYRPPRNENVNQQSSTFSTPVRAILSVISLTAGDVDMGGVFYSDSEENASPGSQYESLALCIWLAAVIIMSVLFNNMLVGLAVGEVRAVTNEARITTIKQRINLVLSLEEQLPEIIHSKLIRREPIEVYPYSEHYFAKKYVIPWFFRSLLKCCCIGFSILCFNLSHLLYWFDFDRTNDKGELRVKKQPKLRQSYRNVPQLIKRNRVDALSQAEKGMSDPVTKRELLEMLNDFKKELKH